MRSFGILLTALSLACAGAQTPAPAAKAAPKAAPLPALKKNGAVTQMMVDGSPFLMLAGELHNSSASSIEYMKPVWNKLSDLRLNTVVGTVSWDPSTRAGSRRECGFLDAASTATNSTLICAPAPLAC